MRECKKETNRGNGERETERGEGERLEAQGTALVLQFRTEFPLDEPHHTCKGDELHSGQLI